MHSSSKRPFTPLALVLAVFGWPAAALADVVVVPVPSPYSYDTATLRQLNLRGSWGRYLGFTGHSVIEWPAVPAQLNAGNPGTIRCDGNRCWREGYVGPSLTGGTPAGSLRHYFNYQLDCREQTFDRIGDARVQSLHRVLVGGRGSEAHLFPGGCGAATEVAREDDDGFPEARLSSA